MLDTMLDHFYLFIFVAGAGGLGAVKRAGRKFFTSDEQQHPANVGDLVRVVVPVEESPSSPYHRLNIDGPRRKIPEATGHHLANPTERTLL